MNAQRPADPVNKKDFVSEELEDWESEEEQPSPAHYAHGRLEVLRTKWNGRPYQRKCKCRFDRVAAAFRSVAERQYDGKLEDTEAIIAILEEKRAEVMKRAQAGYFIHDCKT